MPVSAALVSRRRRRGTHIVERNLTRLTVVLAILFFANTVVLYRLLA